MSATTPIELTDSDDSPNGTPARPDAENIGAKGATSVEGELPQKKGKAKLREEDEGVANVGPPGHERLVTKQDTQIPFQNVVHIMKAALPTQGPEGVKIAKDAKEKMQECVSEFVAFITSEANDKCIGEKRKAITGDDILFALTSTGFENYGEALKIYLARYREHLAVLEQQKAAKKAEGQQQTTNAAASNGSVPAARDRSLEDPV